MEELVDVLDERGIQGKQKLEQIAVKKDCGTKRYVYL